MRQIDDVIDLVIPRGSNRLVSQIKSSTKIPVLGHSGTSLACEFVTPFTFYLQNNGD